MTVITISREYGSDGEWIAQKVAQVMGYPLADKEFIGKLLSQYGLVEFDKEYNTLPGFWEKFDAQRQNRRDTMFSMLRKAMHAIAEHDNVVILGRSGCAVLAGFENVFHVRIQAPYEVRVKRIMEQEKLSAEKAEELVKERDNLRLAFVEEFCGLSWQPARAFDLVINTDRVSPERAANWVIEAVQALSCKPQDTQPSEHSIQVDPILASAVAEELAKV